MIYSVATQDVSLTVQIVNDSGVGVTGIVAVSWPGTFWHNADGIDVSIPIVNLANLSAPHVDGGVFERGGGYYRLCLPDTVCAQEGSKRVWAEASGKHLIAEPIIVQDGADLSDQAIQDIRAAVLMPGAASQYPAFPLKGKLLRVTKGDDYVGAFAIPWAIDNADSLPDMTGWTAVCRIVTGKKVYQGSVSIAVPTGSSRSGLITMPNAAVALDDQSTTYQLIFTGTDTEEHTLIEGPCTVKSRISAPTP